jgi:hypothetical protein
LSPLLSTFALSHVIRKVQESQVGLKLNGAHQLPAYADGNNIDTKKTKSEPLIYASREVPLDINVHKKLCTCYCLVTRMQDKIVTFLYSRLLPKKVKIGTYKTIVFPVGLHGCETWCLTPRENIDWDV